MQKEIDLLSFLSRVTEKNTKHYRSDFLYDSRKLQEAAQAAAPEERCFFWMSRPSGTWCVLEREAFIRGSSAHNIWTHYADEPEGIIGYLKHKAPMFKPKKVNRYTPEGRAEIHKSLSCVNISILREMMRNPIMDRSVEYNDNRLSLYCGQMGRCYVTKQPLELGHMHCHHRIPRHFGGDDKYGNLVLVTDEVHRLLHATQPDTIAHYMLKLKPDSKQLRTLDRLRRWLQLPEFQSYTSY